MGVMATLESERRTAGSKGIALGENDSALQDRGSRVSLRRLTTARAATVIVFLLIFAMASRVAIDSDMWWHLKVGERILETGEFVYADAFSHTRSGATHKNHSGFAQVVLFALWALAGHAGLTFYVAALATGGMACLYRAGRGSIYMQGFALVFGAACAAAFWSPRPQMFTFFFGAVLLLILYELKRSEKDRLWLLPPLFWLWGNTHGGYFVGLLFVSAFVVGEALNCAFGTGDDKLSPRKIRKLTAGGIVSLAVLPLHPLGLGVFAVPIETLAIGGLRDFIQEWQSPDFAQPYTWSLFILLGLLIIAVRFSRRRIDFTEWLLMIGTLGMALFSGRNLSLFALAAVPIMTVHFDALLRRKGWRLPNRVSEPPWRVCVNLLLIVAVALGAFAHFAYVSDSATIDEALAINYPVAAVERMNQLDRRGNLFNAYNWGGYLIFNAPQHPVFIDGRADLYNDFLEEYVSAAAGMTRWREVFARWDIALALIETESGLAERLDSADDWRRVYRDAVASLYHRITMDEQAAES